MSKCTMTGAATRSQRDERLEGKLTLLSPFEAPEYRITAGEDGVLQFSPPQSEVLGLALSYHYSEEATLVTKMQAATKKWMKNRFRTGNASIDTGNSNQALLAGMKSLSKGVNDEQPPALEVGGDLSVESAEKGMHIRQQNSQNPSAKTRKAPERDSTDSPPKVVNRKGDTKSGALKGTLIPGVSKWKLGSTSDGKVVPKKRQYTKEEKEEIGKNRGNVCEAHRRRKQKV
jgi:hypothetical protein